VLSNVVSNVPAVMIFRPFLAHVANPHRAWLALAMSSTLAGNLTILGSIANLIVVQHARRKVEIKFWDYARVGIPVTVITLLMGIWLL
jgi:Na+/H+ antiporter NhaD/arsenite permease-like protein